MTHLTTPNTYSFHKDGKKFTLHPMPEETVIKAKEKSINCFISAQEFKKEVEAQTSDDAKQGSSGCY